MNLNMFDKPLNELVSSKKLIFSFGLLSFTHKWMHMSVLEVVLLKVKKEVENLDCQHIGVDQQTLRQCCLKLFYWTKNSHSHPKAHPYRRGRYGFLSSQTLFVPIT